MTTFAFVMSIFSGTILFGIIYFALIGYWVIYTWKNPSKYPKLSRFYSGGLDLLFTPPPRDPDEAGEQFHFSFCQSIWPILIITVIASWIWHFISCGITAIHTHRKNV